MEFVLPFLHYIIMSPHYQNTFSRVKINADVKNYVPEYTHFFDLYTRLCMFA